MEDRISAEEAGLFEARVEMEEVSKERRRTKVQGWRASDAVRSGITQKAAAGSQSSKAEVGLCDVSRVDITNNGTLEGQSFVRRNRGKQ